MLGKKLSHMILTLGFFALAATTGTFLSGCDESNKVPAASDTQAMGLVKDAERLQEDVQLGYRLTSLSTRDKSTLTKLLNDIKVGLLRTAERPDDVEALQILKRALKEWDKSAIQLQRIDQGPFNEFLRRVYLHLQDRSSALGVNVNELTWSLFEDDFAAGVAPFSTFSTGATWDTDWALDQPLIKVSGSDVKSWLISPTFDLSQIQNPSFRVEHLFLINRDTKKFATDPFDRKKIVSEVFKVKVSTNYLMGDPNLATWEEIDVSPLPSANNFHAVMSPQVSLNKYKGKQVAVAFVFDMQTSVVGHHYLTWQLNRFELFGAGPVPTMALRPRDLWSHAFTNKEFKPFQTGSFSNQANPPRWIPFSPSPTGAIKFAKTGSTGAPGEAWLLSPRLTINAEGPELFVKEVVRNPDLNKFSLLISEDYAGGDPRNANWQSLVRSKVPTIAPDAWVDLRSGPFDLSAYNGKKIVVAFRFEDDGGPGQRVWEIANLQIVGLAEKDLTVEVKDYKLPTATPAATPSPSPAPTPAPSPSPTATPTVTPSPSPSATPDPGTAAPAPTPADSSSAGPANPPTVTTLASWTFTTGNLAPFVVHSEAGSAAQWIPFGSKGAFKYAKAGSGNAAADTWLLSPRLALIGLQQTLKLVHSAKNPDWTKWQVLVTTDELNGAPSNATWQALNLNAGPGVTDKWSNLTADLDLSKYAGQKIVIAFRYQDSGGAGARIWEIESLQILGLGQVDVGAAPLTTSGVGQ